MQCAYVSVSPQMKREYPAVARTEGTDNQRAQRPSQINRREVQLKAFMAIKKSKLYSSVWKSCDELRRSMDASQYRDYALVLLFVKYASNKYVWQNHPEDVC